MRGDQKAVNQVLDHYSGYIAALPMRRGYDQNGNPCLAVDEEICRRRRSGTFRIHGTRESLGRPTMMSWKAVPHFFDIYNKTEESTRKLTLPT